MTVVVGRERIVFLDKLQTSVFGPRVGGRKGGESQ